MYQNENGKSNSNSSSSFYVKVSFEWTAFFSSNRAFHDAGGSGCKVGVKLVLLLNYIVISIMLKRNTDTSDRE